ncbi:DUF6492 family protein [Massilia sp.]|uniref:DUF6492 family protein n=1 Tax=Massilia sp. TaxID=1882437 RepID=UPI00352C36B1
MPELNRSDCEAKLSFVLPFTLREDFCDAASWRKEVNEDATARFLLLLRSFIYLFAQNDLCEFIVICPAAQCTTVRNLILTTTNDPRYIVIAEEEFAPALDTVLKANAEDRGGWYAQQVVKLAAHRIVSTRHYFVLDSDLVCIRPCSYATFVIDRRPLLNVESAVDYARLYRSSFATAEMGIKTARRQKSMRILGVNVEFADPIRFYGETPVILSAPHVMSMLGEVERVHDKGWVAVLASEYGWTEYGLYFGYLDALRLTERIYHLGNCNTILSLEKSIWQETRKYQSVRRYDCSHFFDEDDGFFVAIQSWIPKNEWLPNRYDSKLQFYRDIEKWLADRYPKSAD